MTPHEIVHVSAVDCDLISANWNIAAEQAPEIDRHWEIQTRMKPDLFNGHVLLLHHGGLQAGPNGEPIFRGSCFETDYKSFLAWRELGFRAGTVRNIFCMAALESSDGAFVLGEMGPHTAPAGQIYFPAGTPDRHDIVGTKVDIEGSARRELREETGLDVDRLIFEPGLTLVMEPVRLCCMKHIRSPEKAETLVTRIHAWLANEPKPELIRMHIVREPRDITSAMPGFVIAYLRSMLANR